jgi:hypothetical protein
VFFAAGTANAGRSLLGAARLEIGRRCGLIDESAWAFTWVVDAPMFEEDGEGGWTAVHHPFTAPLPEWEGKFAAEPGGALADAYDIVCNGYEIASGGIRNHRPDAMVKAFEIPFPCQSGGGNYSCYLSNSGVKTGARHMTGSFKISDPSAMIKATCDLRGSRRKSNSRRACISYFYPPTSDMHRIRGLFTVNIGRTPLQHSLLTSSSVILSVVTRFPTVTH